MDTWLKKVEEVKKMRQRSATTSETTHPTPAPAPTPTQTNPSTSGKQATAPKSNPFLMKTQSQPVLNSPNQTSTPATQTNHNTASSTVSNPPPTTNSVTATSSTSTTTPSNTTSPSSSSSANPFLKKLSSATLVNNSPNNSSPPNKASTFTPSLSQSMKAPPTSSNPNTNTNSSVSNTATPAVGEGIFKVKYEQEMKRRIEVEAQLNSKVREIEQLRYELSQAKGINSEEGSGVGSSIIGNSATGNSKKIQDRKTKRMTKAQRKTQMISSSVLGTLDSVLQQIGGLDKRLRAAEAARIQAEDKLMEIAIAKLEVDEVVNKVDQVLKKIIDQIDKFSISQLKEMLLKVRSQTAPPEEGGGSRATLRFSLITQSELDLGIEAPPPPPPISTNENKVPAPAPPPPLPIGGVVEVKPGSLLEQIRKGRTLRNIDVATLKEEQQQFREKAKEAIGSMKSLEEVLREALTNRVTEMNLYEDESEEEEEWE